MKRYDNFGRVITDPNENDPRYMIRLYLIRDGRPQYWNFHCMYCGEKLCEVNGKVVYMTDIAGDGLESNMLEATRIRCTSRTCGGRAWFALNF